MLWWERVELFLTLAYIALYATVGLQGLWEGYFSKGIGNLGQLLSDEGTSWLLFTVSLVGFPLAVAGMALYAMDLQNRTLSSQWRGVVILLLILFPVERVQHYREFVREPDPQLTSKQLSEAGFLYALLVSLYELPCLWMNIRFALPG